MAHIHTFIHTMNHSGLVHAAVMASQGLVKQGHQVTLVIIGQKCDVLYDIDNQVKIEFLGVQRGSGLLGKLRYVYDASKAIKAFIHTQKVSNVFVWGKEFTALITILRSLFKLNIRILGVNGTGIKVPLQAQARSLKLTLLMATYKWIFSRVDHVIAQSRGMVDEMVDFCGVRAENITVAYPALAAHYFEHNDSPQVRNNEIIFVGRLSAEKNPFLMLRAFKQLERSDYTLRMVGDGPLRQECERLVAELGVGQKVTFVGNSDDVKTIMSQAKLLVLTSHFEGFGMVLAESIACGTPVVAVDCPVGPREIVQHNRNGFLVSQNNEDELVAFIHKALDTSFDENDIIQTALVFHPDSIFPNYEKAVCKAFA